MSPGAEAPGRKRVTNMITEGYHRHLAEIYPPGLYLFAGRHSLFSAPDILEHHWLDGAGERRRLLEMPIDMGLLELQALRCCGKLKI